MNDSGKGKKESALRDKPKAATHDEYLAELPLAQQAALEKLRRAVRAAAPRAEECMSYQLPAFRLDGKVLVLYGATAKHCAFYPGSGTAVVAFEDDLRRFSTSKGTIRFGAERPPSLALLRRIVKYRIAENAAQRHVADGASRLSVFGADRPGAEERGQPPDFSPDPPALPLLLDRGEGRGEESSGRVARAPWDRSHPSPRPSPR